MESLVVLECYILPARQLKHTHFPHTLKKIMEKGFPNAYTETVPSKRAGMFGAGAVAIVVHIPVRSGPLK